MRFFATTDGKGRYDITVDDWGDVVSDEFWRLGWEGNIWIKTRKWRNESLG